MIDDLERWLAEITGFDGVSLQPNAGSQGEYAGLLAIRRFHASRGEANRNVCLIPSSAHGTNPASASMAGMRVVVVACEDAGDIDVDDLKAKAAEHAANLAALMITYPSTHGVFEEGVRDICAMVHRAWRAGLSRRRQPQRAGRTGAARRHRRRRLSHEPAQDLLHSAWRRRTGRRPDRRQGASAAVPARAMSREGSAHAVTAAPFGSASILPITWMYIRMMGASGLKQATETAILSANYIAERLGSHYPGAVQGPERPRRA